MQLYCIVFYCFVFYCFVFFLLYCLCFQLPVLFQEVVRVLAEDKADIHVDPLLYKACSIDVLHVCKDISRGEGRRKLLPYLQIYVAPVILRISFSLRCFVDQQEDAMLSESDVAELVSSISSERVSMNLSVCLSRRFIQHPFKGTTQRRSQLINQSFNCFATGWSICSHHHY